MKRISKAAARPFILLAILFATSVHAMVGGFSDGKSAASSRSGGYGNVPLSRSADAGSITAGDRHFFKVLKGSRHALAEVYGRAGSGSFILEAGGDSPHSFAARVDHANHGYQVPGKVEHGIVRFGVPAYTGQSNSGTPLKMAGFGIGGHRIGGYGMGVLWPGEKGGGVSMGNLFDHKDNGFRIFRFATEYYCDPFASPVPELAPSAYWLMGLLLLGGVALLHRGRTGSCNQSATKS